MNVMNEAAIIIRKYRKLERKETQEDFAKWLGISKRTLINMEQGKKPPSISTYNRVLKKCKYPKKLKNELIWVKS